MNGMWSRLIIYVVRSKAQNNLQVKVQRACTFWSFHWIIKLAPKASHKNKHTHARASMQTWRNEKSVRKYELWIKYRLIWHILSVWRISEWMNECQYNHNHWQVYGFGAMVRKPNRHALLAQQQHVHWTMIGKYVFIHITSISNGITRM